MGTPIASAQGLIYQKDRSRCQGIPQKSAGLECKEPDSEMLQPHPQPCDPAGPAPLALQPW